MANKPVKELSRRDALKLLGAAAGASVLANLPSKWSTPELTAGVLPAHAQTSALYSLSCDDLVYLPGGEVNEWQVGSAVHISPVAPGVLMNYVIVLDNMVFVQAPLPASPDATNASGQAAVEFGVAATGEAGTTSVTVTWSFANPSDGTGSCFRQVIFPVVSA
jgi:hypothetical protein